MIPQIFNFGSLPINSFGLSISLSILAAIFVLNRSFALAGLNEKLAEKYVFTGGIIGLLGARLWYVFIVDYQYTKNNLLAALSSSAGFTFYGGFILATTVLIIMSRFDKLPLAKFLDSFGPALAIGYMIGRLGCQLSGDGDYGIVTKSIFGMSFSHGVVPTNIGELVFPTPFYESVIAGFILLFLCKIEKISNVNFDNHSLSGISKFFQLPLTKFFTAILLLSIERFFIEFLRINPKFAFGFSQAQYIAIALSILSIMWFLWVGSKGKVSN